MGSEERKTKQDSSGDSYALSKQDLWEGARALAGRELLQALLQARSGWQILPQTKCMPFLLSLHDTYDAESEYVIFLSKKDMPGVVYVPHAPQAGQ